MKKFIAVLSAFIITLPFIIPTKSEALNFPLTTPITSESAMVMNLDTGTVIHEKNADAQQMPGSVVNIMVAIVCLENCKDLDEEITVDSSVYDYLINTQYPDDLRYADICNGDVLTVNDLLYAMMLTSSVEACETLANHFGNGNVDNFVKMMNDKAAEIGCTSTHFMNPTGLFDAQQYTTARDVMKMTKYALGVSVFETISTAQTYNPSVPNLQNHADVTSWVWTNSNVMMDPTSTDYYYKGAKGIKTATLNAIGRNIVSMASKDGNNYLIVAMKSPINNPQGDTEYYHVEDAIILFDWAFEHFSYKTILDASEEVGELPVELAEGNDYVLLKPKEEYSDLWYDGIDTSLISKEDIVYEKGVLQAPISKGQKLGVVHLKYSGEEIAAVDLVAVSDVKRSVTKYNMYAAKKFKDSKWFSTAILISSILSGVYILLCIYSFICYKNNAKPISPVYAVPRVKKNKKQDKNDKSEK